ncbi:DUF2087 domain-containing protein [Acutalibacter caecimuris]|uniref:DUF2087 domain-containing protein n=1 Tax=Acutalibacter caecimuris TaxID=3093657 RepID=UPI002AC988D0|nr:DUF2087 domain-containing protein [Acutalibacter sp. M00118]
MKSLQNFLDGEGRLVKFPAKRAMQQQALVYLAGKFQPGQAYTEQEVNGLLCQWHSFRDPATLRRALCDGRFLSRDPYGRCYRLAGEAAGEGC